MKDNLKIGIIGMGARGNTVLHAVLFPIKSMLDFCAVCDNYADRTEDAADLIEKETGKRPFTTQNWREVVTMELDAVVIMSAWESHIEIATAAMEAGKYVGMEVGGAYSVEDCWRLVHTSEKTGMPCMLLENCCYGKREMMVLNMVKKGFLGQIVHCKGGYQHDLRSEIACGIENRHYRLRNYLNRNCENYPTHELGPIAKVLNINNGNRMVSLTSTASCARGMHAYLNEEKKDSPYVNSDFAQGDVITTTIRCAGGETISMTLDTTLPRTYSRGFTVRGTKGSYFEDNDSVFLDHVHNEYEFRGRELWGNASEYEKEWQHPIWKNYVATEDGHGGMDGLVYMAFFDACRAGIQTPIDVYDTASWICISPLSEQSIACGGQPVAIPDFTSGRWMERTDIPDQHYQLHAIPAEPEQPEQK